MLFVYSSADHFLPSAGRLGFVITQTVFKTKGAGDGFRRFQFDYQKKKVFLKPVVVHDLSQMQVFEGATNRTSVVVCERKGINFEYPIPYFMWSGMSRIDQDETLAAVLKKTKRIEMKALPVDSGKSSSPWLTAPATALLGIQKVIGKSDYKAWEGVNTGGLNGCFWIQIIEKPEDGTLLIENLSDVGKIKVEQVRTVIESDLVYPLLRGRDISRWHAEPSAHIILAQDPEAGKGISESEMKKSCPKTYAYFKKFEGSQENFERGTLRGRALYKQYFRQTDPFYSMYNVGTYSLSQWKVMWPEVGNTVRAGVCGPRRVDSEKPALPDHTIVAISCRSGEEAHYICALLNSSPVQCATSGYIVLHPSPHIMEHISIPRFNPKETAHRRLRELAEASHLATAKGDIKGLALLEAEIDHVAAKLWGITNDELKSIQKAQEDSKSRRTGVQEEDDE